jgi:hypothetical protein
MEEANVNERKGPGRATISPDDKILVGRAEAAGMLSISCRALDYLALTSNSSPIESDESANYTH